ncbi:sensor histidine kinase [Pediococcus ethanolidurans]|uniref:sensor histidine kinase n=1 Tax=Pediococcus ethanolidurans TaxID=319653 RepID=UPI000710957D|nr:HAMP domain-containing sensor histidine kinase [Pediococcus ethanolidurans]MDV7720065.1 HAMP domain-containing protein [Pediococcus ethanolidurans]
MKLLYQQMLAFFAVIFTTVIIFGLAFIQFSNRMVYQDTWKQLESYADSVFQQSIVVNSNGEFEGIQMAGLENSERLLANQSIHFTIYNKQNTIAYPKTGISPNISKSQWTKLKAGETLTTKSDRRFNQAGNSRTQSMTDIIKPYRNESGEIIAVVSVGSPVANIQSNMRKIQHNLLIAFLISGLAAIVIAYGLAKYSVSRIDRIRKAAHKIGEGNFDITVPTKGNDEIDGLASDFNHMTKSLKASNEEIKRQEQRRREFLADAAHEMRTPLTTINGLLEGLTYDAIPEESREESLQLMSNETKRLIRLVNDNLDYEKIRTNQIILNRHEINVHEVVNNLVEQLQKKANEAKDQFITQVSDKVTVYADYDRFVQIMFNIMQNSIQFTTGGTITITARNDADKNCIISISDTGIGMSEDQMKNIWERYYKADASRKNTKYGESGLGMAIVHQLVKAHKGTISVASELGKGTTFTVQLPYEEPKNEKKSLK